MPRRGNINPGNVYGKYGSKRQTRRATFAKVPRKPLVKMMKKVALKVAESAMETKYVCDTVNAIAFNSAVTAGAEQYSLYPKLGPGTNTWERVGIDVHPIRVKNTWVVSLNTVTRSNNIIVHLFCLIDKNNRFYPNVVASGAPQFLRSGQAAGSGLQGFNGFNTDAFKMINKERYTLLKHFSFQLAANVGSANGDTTAGNAPNVATQSAKTISYVVDAPKTLRYDPTNTTANYPNGHAPFWVLGYTKVDGSAPDVGNQSVTVSHITEMIYKDA